MRTPQKLGAAALVATASLTLATGAGSAAAHPLARYHGHSRPDGAVFVQTDNLAGNAIAVYQRGWDGTLSRAGSYATGGLGGMLSGSQVDHLASQNSLVYDRGAAELFAVNAGSDTVSVFGVDGTDLHLRQVIGSGGSFPASIAVHGGLVYVLNTLGGGTVQGFRLAGGRLVPIPGSSRALDAYPEPSSVYTTTPGDIAFTPDGSDLLITTKGSTNAIDVFAVDHAGRPAATPVVNDEPGDVPFALAFEGGNQVAVAEAGTDAVATFDLKADGTLEQLDSLGTGETATCWLVADGPALFAGNAGSGTESSLWDAPAGTLTLTATTGTDPGTVDAATSPGGRFLYVQTGGNGIVDEFQVGAAGALTEIGFVTVPGAAGGEGIATS